MTKNGGYALVEALAAHGAARAFCVAGESYLPVLDALLEFPDIRTVTCRHESGAAFMAGAYGQLTGRPGIAFVTRGPGACNASIGVHAAMQASVPLILFAGLIAARERDKEAFQEFDIRQMFAPLAKWAAVIGQAERIPEYVTRAFHIARSGRPGPVVLGLPENILSEAAGAVPIQPIETAPLIPSEPQISALKAMLTAAERPVAIVGGSGWRDKDCENLAAFASAAHLPVACAFRRQDLFNHVQRNYIGELGTGPNPKLVERVRRADLLLVLGARLNEITAQGYTLVQPGQKLVHVYPDAAEFGKSFMPDLAVQAHPGPVVSALAAGKAVDGRRWAGWRDEARADYTDWTEIAEPSEPARWKGADMTQVFRQLRDLLPADAIVTTDAGNFSGWCQRYLRYGRPGRLLAPVSGAMGYAVPAAAGAALERPERLTLGVCGDGGFLMTGQELATAMHHGAKPVIMVCNNNMYGTIRMHQERHFPGRISATGLTNPDFVKLAESYGAFAARVEEAGQFTTVWEQAVHAGKPALIEIRMDPAQITTRS